LCHVDKLDKYLDAFPYAEDTGERKAGMLCASGGMRQLASACSQHCAMTCWLFESTRYTCRGTVRSWVVDAIRNDRP